MQVTRGSYQGCRLALGYWAECHCPGQRWHSGPATSPDPRGGEGMAVRQKVEAPEPEAPSCVWVNGDIACPMGTKRSTGSGGW